MIALACLCIFLIFLPALPQEGPLSQDDEQRREDSVQPPGPVLEGRATLGLRFLRIDGSEEQFDEDRNLSEGLFLRDFELSARGLVGWPVENLALRAHGVGEAFSSYRLETHDGPLRTIGRFDKSRFAANAQADQHPFDLEREIGALDFEYAPGHSGKRTGFGVDFLHRDGLWIGSRSAGLETVAGIPVRREERGTGMHGTYATEAAGWELDLRLSLRKLRSEDALRFESPSPGSPAATLSEDFRGTADSTSSSGGLGLTRELSSAGAKLELGFEWQSDDVLGNSRSQEAGFFFDPSLPFERTTLSDLDLSHERVAGNAALVWPLGEESELEVGYTRELESRDGREPRTVVLDELMGDPPSLSEFEDTSRTTSTLDLFSLGVNTHPTGRTDLDLSVEWGSEELNIQEVVEDVTVRRFDDTLDQLGGEGKFVLDMGRGWSLDLGAGHEQRPTESAEIGVAFDIRDDRADFGRAGCRWRGKACSLEGSARIAHRKSEALTSQGDYGTYALAFAGQVGEHATVDLGAALQTYSLESETNFLFFVPGTGIVVVPGVADFDGHQVMLNGSLELALAPLKPNLSWSAAFSTGSSRFDYESARLGLPWSLAHGFEVGIDTAYLAFDGDGALDDSDYDALLVEFFVRYAFGPAATVGTSLP